jgi:hypothetical protein
VDEAPPELIPVDADVKLGNLLQVEEKLASLIECVKKGQIA